MLREVKRAERRMKHWVELAREAEAKLIIEERGEPIEL
jgi:hypothetical protein